MPAPLTFFREILITMPNPRKTVFRNGEFYHVFNRSIASEKVFSTPAQLRRVLDSLEFYLYKQNVKFSIFKTMKLNVKLDYLNEINKTFPLVEIYAFAIMPNHFHILLKQTSDHGVISFISNFQNSYAKYFNKSHGRDGSLFKSPFKSVHIDSDNVFLQVIRYIHLNPVTSCLTEINLLDKYEWTSYCSYLDPNKNSFLKSGYVLKLTSGLNTFIRYTQNQVDYQRKLKYIKDLSLEK